MNARVQIYDPPMCCPSGVCGSAVHPALSRFAADVRWLQEQGVGVERYNLADQPEAFARSDVVSRAMAREGYDCLPLLLVDGKIVARCSYPGRESLSHLAGLTGGGVPEVASEYESTGSVPAGRCRPKDLRTGGT